MDGKRVARGLLEDLMVLESRSCDELKYYVLLDSYNSDDVLLWTSNILIQTRLPKRHTRVLALIRECIKFDEFEIFEDEERENWNLAKWVGYVNSRGETIREIRLDADDASSMISMLQ